MVEEERVEVEEKEENVGEGVVILGPVSCVLTRPLIERSMGEQLEFELSASLLSLGRLLSWVEHSLSDVTEEEPLGGRVPQLSSRCPFLVSCFWLLWLLSRSSSKLLHVWGGRAGRESKPLLSLGGWL